MGLFFEVIIVAVVTWLMARSALQWWRERRLTRGATGLHDAGVRVNERAWKNIVTELESGDRHPRAGGPRDRMTPSERLGHDEQDRRPGHRD